MRFFGAAIMIMMAGGCLEVRPDAGRGENNPFGITAVLPELGAEAARSESWPVDASDFVSDIRIVNNGPLPVFVLANNHESVFYRLEYRTGPMRPWMRLGGDGDGCCPFREWIEIPASSTRALSIGTENPMLKGYHRAFLHMTKNPDGSPDDTSNLFEIAVYPNEPERTEVRRLSP